MNTPFLLSFASFASLAKPHNGKGPRQFCQSCQSTPSGVVGKARLKDADGEECFR
jgi:hypothetical protein